MTAGERYRDSSGAEWRLFLSGEHPHARDASGRVVYGQTRQDLIDKLDYVHGPRRLEGVERSGNRTQRSD
jgi:hypothetical protein